MHHHIVDRVYLLTLYDDQLNIERCPYFEYLCPLEDSKARADEGKADLGRVYDFCQSLENRLQSTDRLLALLTPIDDRGFRNTVFLVGAYVIMMLERDLETTMQYLDPNLSQYSRIPEQTTSTYIRLQAYLGALFRAKQIGWVDFRLDRFDVDEYRQLDSPLNADLHEVVPGKIVMMRGPRDLPGGVPWRDVPKEDGRFGHREFSPGHYADILAQLDVCAVVRCSTPAYDREGFERAGIAVVDLCCEDGVAPPIDVVSKFLAVAEELPGAIAVHCESGRGRSGTLMALYLMKHHGFSAREAVGWLQIVRPGW